MSNTLEAVEQPVGGGFNAGETVEVDAEEAVKLSDAIAQNGGQDKPVQVKFQMSSSAGAGSALFHTYRSERRREQDRMEAMKRVKSEGIANKKFMERRKQTEDKLNEQTSKKRDKRRKRKEKQRLARKKKKGNDGAAAAEEDTVKTRDA
jgi:hypothetical protein|eukprot:g5191.t1